jgi:hypothetical protein
LTAGFKKHGVGVLFNNMIFIQGFIQIRQMVKIKKRYPKIQTCIETQNTVISEASFFGEKSKPINFSERFIIRIL